MKPQSGISFWYFDTPSTQSGTSFWYFDIPKIQSGTSVPDISTPDAQKTIDIDMIKYTITETNELLTKKLSKDEKFKKAIQCD